jgi:hypothetical protein
MPTCTVGADGRLAVESIDRGCVKEVTVMMAIFGAFLPRFVLLVGWVNDRASWESLFGSPVWFLFGFLFFPWTTLIYGIVQVNGMTLLNWIFVGLAFLIDLGTWGIGFFASRQQVSNYRGT